MLTKSDHKSIEIDISRNNTHDKIAQGTTLLKRDLREPKKKSNSKESVNAGRMVQQNNVPTVITNLVLVANMC